MELWFRELQTPDLSIGLRVSRTIYRQRSAYQDIAVLDTPAYGRVLTLDGVVQTTERDEFVYHEMIAHVPMMAHPHPRTVLIVGGGDGGTVREALRHSTVERVVLAEIDPDVVAVAREHLPTLSCGLSDPRCEIMIGDGIDYVAGTADSFDVIIVDSTDPIGPAEGLFTAEFYTAGFRALREDGILVAQTESPFVQAELIRGVRRAMGQSFPIVDLYLAAVPTYPTGLWSFSIGSRGPDPSRPQPDRTVFGDLRYYTRGMHEASFALPPFVHDIVGNDQ